MEPEGMRYASTKNARMNRKIARVPAIDLKCSQARRESGLPPPRAAATTFFGLSVFFLATGLALRRTGRSRWNLPCVRRRSRAAVQLRLQDDRRDAVLAGALRLVQPAVGQLQELRNVAMANIAGDAADAGGHRHDLSSEC